jgi:CRISPR-associated protein Cas1
MKSLRYKTIKEKEYIKSIEYFLEKIPLALNNDELLGLEGNASKIFFETYFKNMGFIGRKPRCKIDIYNLLFDIGYTYLFNFIEALELFGFDILISIHNYLSKKSLFVIFIGPSDVILTKK